LVWPWPHTGRAMERAARAAPRLAAAVRAGPWRPACPLARIGRHPWPVRDSRASSASTAGGGSAPSAVLGGAGASAAEAAQALWQGFQAQAEGRQEEALCRYRAVQRAPSPTLRALASNAEGLLLLRLPVGLAPAAGASGSTTAASRLEPCAPGDSVLAPWAEDGGEYGATLVSVDTAAGECTVDWADGGETHRVVPLAGVATLEGGVSACAAEDRPEEVRAWLVRRALRRALEAWQMQAEFGTSHDAFVDLVGVLCDMASAEVRVALASPAQRWLAEGLGHARRHLQRARWAAERAYAPDPRALAVLCMHRAELLRLTSLAACGPTGGPGGLMGRTDGAAASLREVLQLHQRTAAHLATAKFKRRFRDQCDEDPALWSRPGGSVAPEVLHELLWAKALASLAALPNSPAKGKRRAPGRLRKFEGSPSLQHRMRRTSSASSNAVAWSLPEKLLPPGSGMPTELDALLKEIRPERVAVARAWRALCAAAGEPVRPGQSIGAVLRGASAKEAARLAFQLTRTPPDALGSTHPRLLLEVGSIIFAMGCKMGRGGWARTLTTPLLGLATQQLTAAESVDDAPAAATMALAALRPAAKALSDTQPLPAESLRAAVLAAAARSASQDEAQAGRMPRWRWRLMGYRATEELWLLRHGPHRVVHLPAAAPLTWCPEGLALSETAPTPQSPPTDTA